MRPGNPAFLVWIGDIAELVNSVWGTDSAEAAQLAEALRNAGSRAGGDQADRKYLERLGQIERFLNHLESELNVRD
jgi:hypothetical protein